MPRPFLSSLFLTMFASSHGLGSHGDLIKSLVDARILKSKPAIDAMLAVDRRNYAPARPYNDEPVPLMCGQTISAPHMHAYALEALLPNVVVPNANVLDVGSGSGYFTVLLARANAHARVHGIEVVPDLVHLSIRNAQAQDGDLLASGKLSFQEVDGWQGLPQAAPFDAIHVGAAAEALPEALVAQLKVGGRMFIPVGGADSQTILLVTRTGPQAQQYEAVPLMPVRYVPLVKKNGSPSREL
jgi:protein-L-isoaspartate(D-aspartate) O-methyltransferase